MSEHLQDDAEKKFEITCGLTLASFAAALAVSDVFAGKFGDDEIIAINEKAAAYQWYQSKSIKESMAEANITLIESLAKTGAIEPQAATGIKEFSKELGKDVARYKKEKTEILKGSSVVGKENWVQDKGGQLGQITGAVQWEAKAEGLDSIGNIFDIASLLLQLCLVLGAIALVMQGKRIKQLFYSAMFILGCIGSAVAAYAIWSAFQVG